MALAYNDVEQERSSAPTFGYYRQPNGWITVSPATALEELKYRREKWEPLTQYGTFEMATEYAADHPLEALFMLGGVGELSVDQIVQQGLYLDPPLVPSCRQPLSPTHKRHSGVCMANARPIQFPQMDGVTGIGPFECHFCGSVKPTEKARNQHESVMHKEERGQNRTGESLAAAMLKGMGMTAPVAPTAQEWQPTQLPYVCGHCGADFNNVTAMVNHVSDQHED